MRQNKISVAIDGPAGAGKSTIARAVAKQLGFVYVDTGALYRAIGLAVYRRGVEGTDVVRILDVLPEIQVELRYLNGVQRVLLNGEDVSEQIRTPQISIYASQVSAIPQVRTYLLDLQRSIAEKQSVIMDGRDIGTVILPNADVKIFLTASPEKRAARRCAELQQKGTFVPVEQILRDMQIRDEKDRSRAIAPLQCAQDAQRVDTSSLTLEESVQKVLSIISSCMEA